MRRTTPALFLTLLLPLLLWESAAAQELEPREIAEPGWMASLGVSAHIFDVEAEGSATNLIEPGTVEASDSDSLRQLLVDVGVELASPRIDWLPGSPRIFLAGGAGLRTESATDIFDSGSPESSNQPELEIDGYQSFLVSNIALPRNCVGNNVFDIENNRPNVRTCRSPQVFSGQGSTTGHRLEDISWFANLGTSFQVSLLETLLVEIRPSLAYRVETVDLDGALTFVRTDDLCFENNPQTCVTLVPRANPNLPMIPDQLFQPYSTFSVFRSRARESDIVQHHLGPSLELGVVLSKDARRVRTTLFVNTSLMWLLGDRTERFADPDGVASYEVEFEPWAVRGNAGLRFSWIGGLPSVE